MVPAWTETCRSKYYNFKLFWHFYDFIIVCISWNNKKCFWVYGIVWLATHSSNQNFVKVTLFGARNSVVKGDILETCWLAKRPGRCTKSVNCLPLINGTIHCRNSMISRKHCTRFSNSEDQQPLSKLWWPVDAWFINNNLLELHNNPLTREEMCLWT
jgi:hypothetical protein